MEVVVTGGAGFIGSNLARSLAGAGHRVSVIDNLHTGDMENLAGLDVEFRKANAGDIGKLGITRPQVIFHEGIYSSSPMYNADRTLISKSVEDFVSLLEYARKNDCEIVFAATSSVYNGVAPPQGEEARIPVSDFYTEPRLMMERLGELYNKRHGLKVVGLRYFSVYGPNERSKGKYANLVSQFLWDMMEGRPAVIYGDGTQKRDFTYVEDVVDANLRAQKSDVRFGIYNVGTGRNYTLNALVDILNERLGTRIPAQYVENKIKGYVAETLADTRKAKKEIGFGSKVSLSDGIAKLVEIEKAKKKK